MLDNRGAFVSGLFEDARYKVQSVSTSGPLDPSVSELTDLWPHPLTLVLLFKAFLGGAALLCLGTMTWPDFFVYVEAFICNYSKQLRCAVLPDSCAVLGCPPPPPPPTLLCSVFLQFFSPSIVFPCIRFFSPGGPNSPPDRVSIKLNEAEKGGGGGVLASLCAVAAAVFFWGTMDEEIG